MYIMSQGPSATLLEFTKARFIRLSFQKLAIAANDKVILGRALIHHKG